MGGGGQCIAEQSELYQEDSVLKFAPWYKHKFSIGRWKEHCRDIGRGAYNMAQKTIRDMDLGGRYMFITMLEGIGNVIPLTGKALPNVGAQSSPFSAARETSGAAGGMFSEGSPEEQLISIMLRFAPLFW